MTMQNKFAIFVDILGFASLTEQFPLDKDTLSFQEKLGHPTTTYELFDRISKNKLSEVFSTFHYIISSQISLSRFRNVITSIVFSDSAFIVVDSIAEALHISASIMHSTLQSKIPVRIGIGAGTFIALRFKSDIGSNGGDHASQFLGTAIVRSHSAESCGIKGNRILLHPSAVSCLNSTDYHVKTYPPLECNNNETQNKANVRHEVNYWHFPFAVRERDAWKGFQDMWASTPEAEAIHYVATAEAINRMRVQRGKASMTRLKRRTLPKT